jgi:hypothetical protein
VAGRDEEARAAAKDILRINSTFSVVRFTKRATFVNHSAVKSDWNISNQILRG